MQPTVKLACACVALLAMSETAAADRVSTLTLDAFSIVSFDDKEVYAIPAGSVVPMHFPDDPTGSSIPFSIRPDEVAIEPIQTGAGEGLIVRLIRPVRGTLTVDAQGQYVVSFMADISVSLVHPTMGGSKRLRLFFTTESAQTSSADGKTQLAVSGMRVDPAARALQLVAATRNAQDDYPGPGAAVYAVVSGRLDRLP